MILINLVQENKDVLENKRSDAVTSKDKDKCWKIIEHLFNSRSSSEYRSSEVLRSCWDNLKKKTRKFFADEKMQLYKTGKYFSFTFLCGIINHAVFALFNDYSKKNKN